VPRSARTSNTAAAAERSTTLRDVAAAANVSVATASNVLNGVRGVTLERRERVLQAARSLSYRPDNAARALRGYGTSVLGFVVPDNTNPFFAEVARAVEDYVFKQGYTLILCNTDGRPDRETIYFDLLRANRVDGIIFISTSRSSHVTSWALNQGIPVVAVDRDPGDPRADVVMVDNEGGGYAAARHLIDLGHRHIGCITGPAGLPSSEQRVVGYRRALREFGITSESSLVVRGDFRLSGGRAATVKLLGLRNRPTAIVACNDLMAWGAFAAAKEAALQVPQELSVVGFDDVAFAAHSDPPLTTIAQPAREIGSIAARLLLRRVAQGRGGKMPRTGEATGAADAPERVVLPARLVVRSSTQALARMR
jgi:LacI family transcriptional regulator